MTTIAGSFVDNAQFRGGVDGSLSRVDASGGADRVRAALDSVNTNQLSTQEKNVLMSTIDTLAADGYISDSDANTVVGMVKSFESTGRVFDTLFGGNSGQLNVPQGHQGWTPSDSLRGALGGAFGGALGGWNPSQVAQAASQFPSNPLFGGLLGFAVDKVVQTFKDALFTGAGQGMLGTCDGSEGQQALSKAFEGADLSKLDPQERAEILSQIGFAALDGHISGVESRAIIDTLNNAQDIRPQQAGGWEVKQDGGKASIDLGNYMLDMNEGNSEFTLTNKETGEKIRIWGDPHVEIDGKAVGDFYDTMTLNLEDGTKITIHTTPYDKNNNMTLSTELVITKGDQAMVVQGLDQNTLGDLKIGQVQTGGKLVDWANDDGVSIYENGDGAGWLRMNEGGYMTQVDGAFLSTIRGDGNPSQDGNGTPIRAGGNQNHGGFFITPIFNPINLFGGDNGNNDVTRNVEPRGVPRERPPIR